MIVIGRGSVQQEECDVMGHMNVRHYVARACDALHWLLHEAGLPPSAGGYTLRDQHIRFLRELAPGAPFTLFGGVLEQRGKLLRTLIEIRHSATGEPAATLVSDIEPEGRPHDIEALRVSLPDHAAPRGLSFDPPRPLPDRNTALAMGLVEGHRGIVRLEDCDAAGVMRPEGLIARVWDGIPNLRNGGREVGVKSEKIGGAALEYRLFHLKPLRVGQLVTVVSGLRALGSKTTTWTHLMHDGTTGEAVAAAEAVGVALDLVARRAVALSPERHAALSAMLIPGLGL